MIVSGPGQVHCPIPTLINSLTDRWIKDRRVTITPAERVQAERILRRNVDDYLAAVDGDDKVILQQALNESIKPENPSDPWETYRQNLTRGGGLLLWHDAQTSACAIYDHGSYWVGYNNQWAACEDAEVALVFAKGLRNRLLKGEKVQLPNGIIMRNPK
jgi:hypothetical protein